MRIRPLKPALLGAALLQRLELTAAQEFSWNGQNIRNRLLPTGPPVNGIQDTLVLTYTRAPSALPPVLKLYRDDTRTPILTGPPKMVFTESTQMQMQTQTGAVVSGNITIFNPAEVAGLLDSDPPVPAYFVFSGPENESPQLGAKFGIATPEVSQDKAKLNEYASKMFPDGTQPVTYQTTTVQPTTTQYEPANTGIPTTPTSSPGEGGLLSPGSASPAQPAPNRSALSTGAIAGIAVGASLAVLLLATIIGWFFYWRRGRQKKTGSSGLGYGVGQGRSGDMVAEKEANAIVAESPRSPYSEDGHHRDSTLIGGASAASSGAAGLMAAHHHDRDTAGEYPPYSDHPPTSTATAPPTISQPVARADSSMSRSTADRSSAAIPGSAAPPPAIGQEGLPPRAETGMSGRYAHLVEDGMTPEEIARLEEEERQLDVAIEQARGVTTK